MITVTIKQRMRDFFEAISGCYGGQSNSLVKVHLLGTSMEKYCHSDSFHYTTPP
jgi:hypothetical protein